MPLIPGENHGRDVRDHGRNGHAHRADRRECDDADLVQRHEMSREDPKRGHGAFTKVPLDALNDPKRT
jgi:hypothetical protein